MVHIPPIQATHNYKDQPYSLPSDIVNTLNQINSLMSPLLNSVFPNLLNEIAECSGSQTQMAKTFNSIISTLNNVLSTMNSNSDFSSFWTAASFTSSAPNPMTNPACYMFQSTLTAEINNFLSALGNPANNPPGGLYGELQSANFEVSNSMLTFLNALITPFDPADNGPPMYGNYPSSWSPNQVEIYQSFWGPQAPYEDPWSTAGYPEYLNNGSFLGTIQNALNMNNNQIIYEGPAIYVGTGSIPPNTPILPAPNPWVPPSSDNDNYFKKHRT